MILFEWDAQERNPGKCAYTCYARILSSSITSVSIFSVCCYSSVSISVTLKHTTLLSFEAFLDFLSTRPLYHWLNIFAESIVNFFVKGLDF
jgi:hypothetical protein